MPMRLLWLALVSQHFNQAAFRCNPGAAAIHSLTVRKRLPVTSNRLLESSLRNRRANVAQNNMQSAECGD